MRRNCMMTTNVVTFRVARLEACCISLSSSTLLLRYVGVTRLHLVIMNSDKNSSAIIGSFFSFTIFAKGSTRRIGTMRMLT